MAQPALRQWLWARAVVGGHAKSLLQFTELLINHFFSLSSFPLFGPVYHAQCEHLRMVSKTLGQKSLK